MRVRPSREIFERIPAPEPVPVPKRSRPGFSFPAPRVAVPTMPTLRPVSDDWLARRLRLLSRLLHIDTPFMWRLAAHGVVLVLTLGVLGISSLPRPARSAAAVAGERTLTDWSLRNRSFVPDSVVGITSGSSGQAAMGFDDRPGFVSPGAIVEAHPSLLPWDKPEAYRVSRGDTVTSIAARYGIEPIWLLFANPAIRDKPHELSVGEALTILPMKAVVHVVKEGDTIAEIAETYKSTPEEILSYEANGLDSVDDTLVAGVEIVVPDGEMDIQIPSYRDLIVPRGAGGWASANVLGSVVGSGSFYVGAYGRITQGYHRWHHAVDIANGTGSPIYAVDGGVVKYAGWYQWAGRAVIIDHGNGYESLYAHMNSIGVGPGETVQRGQVIGGIGCSYGAGGRCTGPHLHLEVRLNGAPQNPCALGACP
ncbi:MAG: peptidoglycan DD-metalloendopeptidase family protein [Caldilineae bacterium]|nr:peptidoglycan DD-metalloendopeptidase family protein [Chloroflexota bacterium]MCB9176189.1 peptidoglycan DD-metalloendopeptidase family protein [Caldilineae bacterium]